MSPQHLQLGVIGDPISQSLSPEMFNPALKTLGINGHYDRFHVAPKDLSAFFARIRRHEITGVNVTIPHKQAVIPLLDGLTAAARAIGAVNTVSWQNNKLIGDNTDGEGFWLGLGEQKPQPNDPVCLIGAGGAARAIGYTLLKNGCANLTIINRNPASAHKLRTEWQALFPDARVNEIAWDTFLQNGIADCACLINATSLGLENQNPWPGLDFLKTLPARALVVEIVAKPLQTEFLRVAHARGLNTLPGWPMLLHQAGLAFTQFTGQTPPMGLMQHHLQLAINLSK